MSDLLPKNKLGSDGFYSRFFLLVNNPLLYLLFGILALFIALFLWTFFFIIMFVSFPPLFFLISFLLGILIIIYPIIKMIFGTANVINIYDPYWWSDSTLVFCKVKGDNLKFFGFKNYSVPISNIAKVIETRFFFDKTYQIFYYKDKTLCFTTISILFCDFLSAVPQEKVIKLPGVFSYHWFSRIKYRAIYKLLKEKDFSWVVDFIKLYFNIKEQEKFKGTYQGGGYICDYRYCDGVAKNIIKKGFFDTDPLWILFLSFICSGTWPFFQLTICSDKIQLGFQSLFGKSVLFNIPKENLKEIVVYKNKGLLSSFSGISFLHNYPDAPQGITLYLGSDKDKIIEELSKTCKISYSKN
ncbi:MAG: hypothetical protein WC821_01735 [archaeon]|jgi:hypothetical protein